MLMPRYYFFKGNATLPDWLHCMAKEVPSTFLGKLKLEDALADSFSTTTAMQEGSVKQNWFDIVMQAIRKNESFSSALHARCLFFEAFMQDNNNVICIGWSCPPHHARQWSLAWGPWCPPPQDAIARWRQFKQICPTWDLSFLCWAISFSGFQSFP